MSCMRVEDARTNTHCTQLKQKTSVIVVREKTKGTEESRRKRGSRRDERERGGRKKGWVWRQSRHWLSAPNVSLKSRKGRRSGASWCLCVCCVFIINWQRTTSLPD